MRERNRNISDSERKKLSESALRIVESMPQFASAKVVAIYSALPDELDTEQAIERWSEQLSKEIVIPKVMDETTIEFFRHSNRELQKGAFGIAEPIISGDSAPIDPTAIDLIIIPGVAFTKGGDRLGRGKGFYDRYLANPALKAHKIGICYPHQIVEKMPCEPHDIKLDTIICG